MWTCFGLGSLWSSNGNRDWATTVGGDATTAVGGCPFVKGGFDIGNCNLWELGQYLLQFRVVQVFQRCSTCFDTSAWKA